MIHDVTKCNQFILNVQFKNKNRYGQTYLSNTKKNNNKKNKTEMSEIRVVSV